MHAYNMQSNKILRKSSFDMDAHLETYVLVIGYIIADVWLKAMPGMPCRSVHVMNFFDVDPLLHFCANFVLKWIQIWVLESQA